MSLIPYKEPKTAEHNAANWRRLDNILFAAAPFILDSEYAMRFVVNKDQTPVALRLETKLKTESEWRVMQSWPLGGFTDVSADRTLTGSESVVLVDTSSGNISITLPAASDNEGNRFTIKQTSNSNQVNVLRSGSDTIDGATSQILTMMDSIDLISNGTNWYII